MDALGEQQAVVAGHDWGAPVAWHTALLRPDRIRGVIGLSVPYRPRGSAPPIPAMRAGIGDGFYMVYFQQPGVADAELEPRPEGDLPPGALAARRGPASPARARRPADRAARRRVPGHLPRAGRPCRPGSPTPTSTRSSAEYAGRGFTGPLNWYRNLDRNWELTGAWHHAPVLVPALYLAGERDLVVSVPRRQGGHRPARAGRAPAARAGAAARLRALDPAGAAGRGQRGHDRLPARAGLTAEPG